MPVRAIQDVILTGLWWLLIAAATLFVLSLLVRWLYIAAALMARNVNRRTALERRRRAVHGHA